MTTVSPAEVEFIAEEETVKITSRFELDRRELICGDFGPFKPGVPTKVPLWMAVNLKQRGLCQGSARNKFIQKNPCSKISRFSKICFFPKFQKIKRNFLAEPWFLHSPHALVAFSGTAVDVA